MGAEIPHQRLAHPSQKGGNLRYHHSFRTNSFPASCTTKPIAMVACAPIIAILMGLAPYPFPRTLISSRRWTTKARCRLLPSASVCYHFWTCLSTRSRNPGSDPRVGCIEPGSVNLSGRGAAGTGVLSGQPQTDAVWWVSSSWLSHWQWHGRKWGQERGAAQDAPTWTGMETGERSGNASRTWRVAQWSLPVGLAASLPPWDAKLPNILNYTGFLGVW